MFRVRPLSVYIPLAYPHEFQIENKELKKSSSFEIDRELNVCDISSTRINWREKNDEQDFQLKTNGLVCVLFFSLMDLYHFSSFYTLLGNNNY